MEPTSKNWWTTLPGVVTSVAGAATAVTGLIVALNQTGWFKSNSDQRQSHERKQSSVASAGAIGAVAKKENADTSSSKAVVEAAKKEEVILDSLKQITIDKKPIHLSGNPGGKIRLDILRATLENHNSQNALLSFNMRIIDKPGWGQNITGSEFILLVDDIPMATNNDAGIYISPNAAAETTASFEVPTTAKKAVLKISYWENSTTVPIPLDNFN